MTVLTSDVELDDAATYVAGLAEKLDQVDEDLGQRARQLVWRGSAADRFGEQVTCAHQTMQANVGQLSWVGQLLRTAADKVRAERAALTADQNLVEAILRGERDPAAFLRRAGWTERGLPPTGDTTWAVLATRVAVAVTGSSGGAPL